MITKCKYKIYPIVMETKEFDKGMMTYQHETGLTWVMPSPNMPSLDTATVYPGIANRYPCRYRQAQKRYRK
jgi:uncharacterized protein YbbC (DUF1343 family)